MHNYGMYIIAIGWLYVTVLVAATEPTLIAAIISFSFYGLLPCGLLLWISGSKVRRQRRAYLESLANERLNNGNRGNTETDK
jgi:apolipoprotein N-acyltransferase